MSFETANLVMKILPHHISSLFDERYITRGKEYFEEGMVKIRTVSDADVEADCIGTRRYRVALALKGGKLTGKCSCPAFEDFGPCKHMAATAFATIAHARKSYSPSGHYIQRDQELTEVERRLKRMRKADLIDFILQHMGDEYELMELLDMDEEE